MKQIGEGTPEKATPLTEAESWIHPDSSDDDPRTALLGWWGETPMGGWATDDDAAFHTAIVAQLEADLLPDGSTTPTQIEAGIHIERRE